MHSMHALLMSLSVAIAAMLPATAKSQEAACRVADEAGFQLKVDRDSPCLRLEALRNTHRPLELFRNAVGCSRAGDFVSAVHSLSLGSAYGHYDVSWFPEGTRFFSMDVLLQQELKGLSDEQNACIFESMYLISADRPRLDKMCSALRKIGPPVYVPNALDPRKVIAQPPGLRGNSSHPEFDEVEAWSDALRIKAFCS